MDHPQAMRLLGGLERFGMRFRLDVTEAMLHAVGDPHLGLRAFHVGGTNGKGSVCAFLTSALAESGLKVGTYTSPHLVRFEERIAVRGEAISQATAAALVEGALPAIEAARKMGQDPTYFEVATVMAFQHFAAERVDAAVIEVGLGGRLDATNVLREPLCSVITNVSLDHTEVLGPTVEHIAWDKAHILKRGCPGVTGAEGAALGVIQQVAQEQGAPLRTLEGFHTEMRAQNLDKQVVELRSAWRDYGAVELPLLGEHQLQNACLAIAALEEAVPAGLNVGVPDVRRGLAHARWPGRLQVLARKPDLLVDGAHNPGAVEALARFVEERDWPHVTLVLGILADKDYAGMCARLGPLAQLVVCTEPPNTARKLDAQSLASAMRPHARVHVEPDPLRAVEHALRSTPRDGAVIVAGSLYLAGAVLAERAR
ncbi:MAG: bifunctional folylpolyglutamate synthase/dihydrofolate synthase [Halobacteriales archaeon]|nr:bifunctional folylpolyglutamate synthase/dihydrofolate synthase [Halobacteriales archaeon]